MPDIESKQSERVPRPTRRQVLQAGAAVGVASMLGTRPAAATDPLLFGINGHPLYSAAYNANSSTIPGVPYSTQVSMLTDLEMQVYRFSVQTNDSGLCNNHAKLLNMYGLLDAAGIQFFPNFYANYSANLSEEDNYQRGFAKGKGIATNYGHMFTHCNLDNEWELKRDLKSDELLGDEQSHYDMAKVVRAMQWIKGANDGMKSEKSEAKTSVAIAGWLPTFWQQYLLDNVGLDFVDWHWYSEMQGLLKDPADNPLPGDETNILDFLWDTFGLPIWISETNSRSRNPTSPALDEQRQVNWFDEWHEQCLAHPHCEAMFLYELLNEPLRPGDSYEEENFGIVKFPNFDPVTKDHTEWEWKQLGRQLTGLDHLIGHFGSATEGWSLGLGPEFPGALGTFTRENTVAISGRWSGVLTGDFSGGGNYVEIARSINLDLSDLRFWARSNSLTEVTLRMTDSTGQCHQQRIPLVSDLSWQSLHVSTFDAGQNYVHWDGANDGVWHAPASRIALLLGRTSLESGRISGAVRFDGVTATVP